MGVSRDGAEAHPIGGRVSGLDTKGASLKFYKAMVGRPSGAEGVGWLKVTTQRLRRAFDPNVQYTGFLTEVLCPQIRVIAISRCGLPESMRRELVDRHESRSLRQLAKVYGVSYECIRRGLRA